jgi:hypothetical protein
MDPRNRTEEEMPRRPQPLSGDDEQRQADDLAPEDERIGEDEEEADDTLGRPVQLEP